MAAKDDLPNKTLVRMSHDISTVSMRAIAVIYMDFEKHKLETIMDENGGNQSKTNTDIFNRWKRRGYHNNKQKLADILYDAATHDLVDVMKVKKHLEVEKSGNPVFRNEEAKDVDSRLTESELGRLALKISSKNIRDIGQMHLDYDPDKLDSIEDTRRGDKWFFMFEVFVNWTYRNKDNKRRKLAELLYEAAELDELFRAEFIEEVLGVKKEDLMTEEIGEEVEIIYDRNSSEANVETGMSTEEKLFVAVPPLDGGESSQMAVDIQAQQFAKLSIDEMTERLRGTKFPQGQSLQMLPQMNHPEAAKFDWLGLGNVKEVTSPLSKKAKPVVVAVVDTGVYEGHPDLKNKLVTSASKCFVAGSKKSIADLTKDEWNHGTMVAGIISLYGPDNVKILNLKVQPVKGEFGNMQTLIDALKHIKTLDGKDNEVDIVNMSVGQFNLPEGLDEIINELASKKILISSAGNYSAHSSNTITYPAKHPIVICVGACNSEGHTSDLSSVGKEVEFLCPGEGVVSTNNMCNGAKYFICNGTSFSSPHAAAVAAHVLVAMEAKKGPACRQKLRKNLIMRNVLRQMCEQSPQDGAKVLQPFNKCFRNLDLLYDYCNIAVEGREGYVMM